MPKTHFVWDPITDDIVQELDETGEARAQYTVEPELYGESISQDRAGESSQLHFDGTGSLLAVTDHNQQVTDTRAYSAFGESTEQSGSTVFPFKYGGQRGYDTSQDGEVHVRRRLYEPKYSRWQSADPIEVPVPDINLYAYADNSPIGTIDPSGLVTVLTTVRVCTAAEKASAKKQCERKYDKKHHPFLISGCLQAREFKTYLTIPVGRPGCPPAPLAIPTGSFTKTTTCCWGPCQLYERWCIWGVRLPKGDKGKPHWPIKSIDQCMRCGDQCMINKGTWKCSIGGGKNPPTWPSTKHPFAPSWPDDGTSLEVLLCQGLARLLAGGIIEAVADPDE